MQTTTTMTRTNYSTIHRMNMRACWVHRPISPQIICYWKCWMERRRAVNVIVKPMKRFRITNCMAMGIPVVVAVVVLPTIRHSCGIRHLNFHRHWRNRQTVIRCSIWWIKVCTTINTIRTLANRSRNIQMTQQPPQRQMYRQHHHHQYQSSNNNNSSSNSTAKQMANFPSRQNSRTRPNRKIVSSMARRSNSSSSSSPVRRVAVVRTAVSFQIIIITIRRMKVWQMSMGMAVNRCYLRLVLIWDQLEHGNHHRRHQFGSPCIQYTIQYRKMVAAIWHQHHRIASFQACIHQRQRTNRAAPTPA